MNNALSLVLASTSVYRQELLKRLGLSFSAQAPLFDEEKSKNTSIEAGQLCQYLAQQKALSLAHKSSVVIGGDQMVVLNGKIRGKPKTVEKAKAQLLEMQGQTHELLTAVSVIHPEYQVHFREICSMRMRTLSSLDIENYIQLDNPLDCAGSYKIEKSGVCLFEKIDCSDFTAIQGLPLIRLTHELLKMGFQIPGSGNQN
jgi:septum formation protein